MVAGRSRLAELAGDTDILLRTYCENLDPTARPRLWGSYQKANQRHGLAPMLAVRLLTTTLGGLRE
jgi:hypothetical protein